MTPEEKAKLKKLHDRYQELKPLVEEFHKVVDELRPMLCPFKIGDRVKWVKGGKTMHGKISAVGEELFEDIPDPSRCRLFATTILPNGKEGREWEMWDTVEKE